MIAESVVQLLEELGRYKRVPQPLHIAEVNFDFAAALVGPDDQKTLTLILDQSQNPIGPALRRLKAFSMVLERSGSIRPITVVLISETPDRDALSALEQLARVILVQSGANLTESLSSLFPLALPQPIQASRSGEETLMANIQISPFVERLLNAAKRSAKAVEEEMQKCLMELASSQDD